MKLTLIAATLVLVGGTAAGCGGGAPADASEKDFCDSYNSLFKDLTGLDADSDDKEIVVKIKAWGEKMEEIGTPEEMPEEAREGFDTTVALIKDLDEESTQEDFAKIDDDLSEDEKAQVDAFDKFTTDTCGSPLDTESPSDDAS